MGGWAVGSTDSGVAGVVEGRGDGCSLRTGEGWRWDAEEYGASWTDPVTTPTNTPGQHAHKRRGVCVSLGQGG